MNSNYMNHLHIILMIQLSCTKGKIFQDIFKHSEECNVILENFASASASFIFCTIKNSRPVHICCSCLLEYNEVMKRHDEILQTKKNQNSTCKENFINQDYLEVIESGYFYIKSMWLKGQCDNCYESNNNSLSNTTKEFISLYSDTSECLQSHYYPANNSYNPKVCNFCSQKYYKMSKYYLHLKEIIGNGNICLDIVDTVNVTEHLWSNVLHCGKTTVAYEIALMSISALVCTFPILFYCFAQKFTKARSSDVLNQNRVSQRFRRRSRSGSLGST